MSVDGKKKMLIRAIKRASMFIPILFVLIVVSLRTENYALLILVLPVMILGNWYAFKK